jgi:hypothetical protein
MDFIFSIPTPPAAIIFSPTPAAPVAFVFSIPNTVIGAGSAGGDLNIYVNGDLDQTVAVPDFGAAVIVID